MCAAVPNRIIRTDPLQPHTKRAVSAILLRDTGKRVEAIAFDLAPFISAAQCGQLLELAASLQRFRPGHTINNGRTR